MDFKEIADKITPFIGDFDNKYWGVALSAEVGEVNDLVKQEHNRGIDIKEELKYELADVFNYIVLMAKHNEIDLEKAILEKIEKAKEKWDNKEG